MSNYPAGADRCPHAPWNKEEELQGESVPLFDYLLDDVEMSKEAANLLQKFSKNRIIAVQNLKVLATEYKELYKIIDLLAEPEILLEDE